MNKPAKDKNIGLVLVTHIDYGEKLLQAAEDILGKQENCLAVSVNMSTEVEKSLGAIKKAVKATNSGNGVLIVTDMFGGTPTNLSLSLLGSGEFEVVTGVNLPMLLKILSTRGLPLDKLALEAKTAGCKGIVVAGELLRSEVADG